MPLPDHLEDLRRRIFKSLFFIGLFATPAFLFYEEIWLFLVAPLEPVIRELQEKKIDLQLIFFRISDAFLLQFKIAFFMGVFLAIPFILQEIGGFFLPAFSKRAQKWGWVLLLFSSLLFYTGSVFAYFYPWPIVLRFLLLEWLPTYEGAVAPKLYLGIREYFSFFFTFHLSFALAFELPILSIVLYLVGVLRSSFFFRSWRYAILFFAIFSAILTPPDIASMLALFFPLCFLYLLSGGILYVLEKMAS